MRSHTTLVVPCLAVIILLFTTGCSHNNAMFFGTNTVVGLDARADASAGGTPTVAIGYRRQEVVWMPLLANQRDQTTGKIVPGPCEAKHSGESDCHFEGGLNKDTYSVLASFGAKAGANASAGVESSLAIAQYFATGLAAQELAAQGGARLVAIQQPEPQVDPAKVNAVINMREKNTQKILQFVVDKNTGLVNADNLNKVLKGTALEKQNDILATIGKPPDQLQKLLTNIYYDYLDDLGKNIP